MSALAIPDPSALDLADVGVLGGQIVAWAESTDDIAAVRDAAARWSAITEYVKRTSREGVAEAETTLRRLDVIVGRLYERPGQGRTSAHAQKLEPSRAREFALMAEHADIVEEVIANSDDASPPSRRKCLTAIAQKREAATWAEDDRQWREEILPRVQAAMVRNPPIEYPDLVATVRLRFSGVPRDDIARYLPDGADLVSLEEA